jgi:hypothetical protein
MDAKEAVICCENFSNVMRKDVLYRVPLRQCWWIIGMQNLFLMCQDASTKFVKFQASTIMENILMDYSVALQENDNLG